jgi:hypothetical protein
MARLERDVAYIWGMDMQLHDRVHPHGTARVHEPRGMPAMLCNMKSSQYIVIGRRKRFTLVDTFSCLTKLFLRA